MYSKLHSDNQHAHLYSLPGLGYTIGISGRVGDRVNRYLNNTSTPPSDNL